MAGGPVGGSQSLPLRYEHRCADLGVRPNPAVLRMLQDRAVECLDLEPHYLGSKGLAAIIPFLTEAATIRSLSLRNSQLTNEVVTALAEACKGHPSLAALDVSRNPISLPAAKALLDLAVENPNIVAIHLGDTEIREQYVERIQLQLDNNQNLQHAGKDNHPVDEESREEHLDLATWEWDSNYGDALADQEQALQELEGGGWEEDGKGSGGATSDTEESSGQDVQDVNAADSSAGVLLHRAARPSLDIQTILATTFGATHWVDPHFPPTVAALCVQGSGPAPRWARAARWRRAGDVVGGRPPALFGAAGVPAMPRPGRLADGWLVGAMAVLACRPALLRRVFCASYPELGVYQLQFFKAGQPILVTVDDHIPCDPEGMPLFAHCEDATQPWPMLLEKAYAKLHGSYDRLALGSSAQALEDLTGGQCTNLTLHTLPIARQLYDDGALWGQLEEATAADSDTLVAASYRAPTALLQKASVFGSGVTPNRLYHVATVRQLDRWTLAQLRDPWRQAVWTGRFGVGAAEWTAETRAALGHTAEAEAAGVMWVTLEDLATFFNRLYFLTLLPEFPLSRWCPRQRYFRHAVGRWVGRSAGGAFREQNWTENPTYLLKVTGDAVAVTIALNQHDARLGPARAGGVHYAAAIGFYVLRTADGTRRKKEYPGPQDTVYSARFVASRAVRATVTLREAEQYLLVLCTRQPGQERAYSLHLHADRPIHCNPVGDDTHEHRLAGAWRGGTAGGRVTGHDTWVDNPQYTLSLPQAERVCVTLHQKPESPTGRMPHVAFYVFRATQAVRTYDPKSVVGFAKFLPYKTVFRELALEAGTYVIVPMTWNRGEEARFELTVYASEAAILARLPSVLAT